MECNNLSITLFLPLLFKNWLQRKYEKDGGRTEMEEEMERVGEGKESLKTHEIQK